MRELTGHKVNPANDLLKVEVLDEPGSGGAHHCYAITGFDYANNPTVPKHVQASYLKDEYTAHILFQNGPINEVGVNGVTHEALLVILIDRMEGASRLARMPQPIIRKRLRRCARLRPPYSVVRRRGWRVVSKARIRSDRHI